MKSYLTIAQLIISALLIFFIIMQNKSEGIGRAIGTETAAYSTRRGIEKTLYFATYFFIAAFLIISAVNFLI